MVVAIRQTTTEEQSEMITSPKQRKAAELAAAQSASLLQQDTTTPPPPSTRSKRKDPRDLGTPPREDNVPPSIVSVDKEASSPSNKNDSRRPQLPTRQQSHNNNNSSQQNPSVNTTGLTPQPFATSLTNPSPSNGAAPAPSLGEEDYKVLTSCIENMGSLDSVSDLLNSPDNRPSEKSRKNNDKSGGEDTGEGRRGSQYSMSSDKVEAASRAAAAVLSSGDKPTNTHPKDFHRQSTELHSNTTNTHNTTNTTHNNNNTTTVQLPPTLNLENHGSAESIVVSSPSLGSQKGTNYKEDDNSSNSLSCSNSPASFMLDVSIYLVLCG